MGSFRKRGFLWIIFGILLVIATSFLIAFITLQQKPEGYVETIATIQRLESEYDVAMEQWDTRVFVRYVFRGLEYTRELGYYTAGMAEGQSITILVNSANPSQIKAFDVNYLFLVISICCYLGALGAAVTFFVLRAKDKKIVEQQERKQQQQQDNHYIGFRQEDKQ